MSSTRSKYSAARGLSAEDTETWQAIIFQEARGSPGSRQLDSAVHTGAMKGRTAEQEGREEEIYWLWAGEEAYRTQSNGRKNGKKTGKTEARKKRTPPSRISGQKFTSSQSPKLLGAEQ